MQKCKRSMRLLVLFLAFALVLGMMPPMPLNAEPVEDYDGEYIYQTPSDVDNGYEYPADEEVPENDDDYIAYPIEPEYIDPISEADFSHLEFGVRPIVTPVAGHFPTSLYRWSIRPGGTDPAVDAHSFGYYLTLVWYPAVTHAFEPNTTYSVEIIMEPVTALWVPEWHSLGPNPVNMWARVIGANVPPSFYEIGATYSQVVGLPTEGVDSVSSRIEGDNLHVTVVFEPTGSAVEDAQLIFFDDFSGPTNRFGLTTAFDRAPNNLFRQDMSIWTNNMSFIRDGQMVLAYQLAPRALVEQHRPGWLWFPNEAARERATQNTIQAGAVRTLTANWLEATFEHAFGYYEARIRFPSQYQHNKPGTWGAFWLMNRNLTFESALPGATGRSGAEIDIFESIDNHVRGQFNAAAHWGGYVEGGSSRSFSQRVCSTDHNDGAWVDIYDGNYHTFSVEWSPTNYRFFVNGVEFGSLCRAREGYGLSPWFFDAQFANAQAHQVNQNPNYIKLSVESALWALNAVGGNFDFPADLYGEMIIDYVAVWNGPRPRTSMVELADYSGLDAALAAANALLEYDYTTDSWAVLAAAIDAANMLPRNWSVAFQYRIDAAAAAITDGINNLVPASIVTFNIFNNGEGGSPSRPNASLAAAGVIRMWTQLDGVDTPINFAAESTIIALDQNGNCAMEFIDVGQMWQAGAGFIPYFNRIDVDTNGAWWIINFAITAHGQTVDVLLVNPTPPAPLPVPGFDIFNNGEGGSPSRPNQSLANAGTVRMWAQLDGVNAPMYLGAADTIVALDQDGNDATDLITVSRMWQAGTGFLQYFNLIDVNKNEPWRYINFSITVYGQLVELLLVNNNYTPTPLHIYDVRPVSRPVAGHFPTGFYRLFLRPNGSAGYVLEHNYGYYQSIAWYPAVSRDFQPNTVYTAIVTLEPHLTSLPEGTNGWWSVVFCDNPYCTNPHHPADRIPPHNDHPDAWVLRPGVLDAEGNERPVWPPNFSSCTTTKPATFDGVTIDALNGLPTDGVTDINIENCTINPANLIIRVTFEATGETQPAQLTLFDDFSGEYNPYDRHGGLTTQFARATDNMWRQSMSYWSFENANIQERDGNNVLVLANELIRETVDDYQAYIDHLLLDYSWVVPTPRERENALRSGAVRTISHDWYEIYFEQSFGYWEARIKLPQERGMWGAFWLMNRYQGTNVNFHQGAAARNGRTGAELDIVEGIISSAANYNESRFNSAVHWNGWGGMVDGSWQGSRSFGINANRNTAPFVNIFDGNWHTFSMEWTPTSYRFFVNGIQFGPTVYDGTHGPAANRHNISHNPTYMKLSTEAGGATPGAAAWPLGNGMHFRDGFFAEMLVDYVRVWNGPRPERDVLVPATLVSVEITGNPVPNAHLQAYAVSYPSGQTLIPAATYQWQHLCHITNQWVNVPNRTLGTGNAAGSAIGGLEYRLTNHIPSAVTTNRRLHLVEGDLAILGYYIRVAVTHDGVTVYSDPVQFREPAHEFSVREIPSPVAGHFPASLYRWALTQGNARAIGGTPLPGHNYGYDHTLVWYPQIERYFQPDTVYTLEWILEPNPEWHGVYWTPLELGIPIDANDMRWWQNIPASMPPSFAANNITHENIVGLPTERVTNITSEHRGDNLHIFITFEATGSEIQSPSVIFHDDFSNPIDTDPSRPGMITAHREYSADNPASGFARATPYLWRQDLSYWDPAMAWIDEDRDLLVLGIEISPDGFENHAPEWLANAGWWNANQHARARRNTMRAGGVRTMSQDWEGVYWENAFGFYEARISFPDPTAVHGAWGAFWLMNRYFAYTGTYSVRGQEIDIVESIDGHINCRFNWALWWSSTESAERGYNHPGTSRRYHASDIADVSIYDGGFHTFGVEWSPTEYIFFVNGIEVGRLSDLPPQVGLGVNRNPNYMKLSMESALWALPGGGGANATANSPLFYSGETHHMYVDYVTVWNGPRPLPSTDRTQLYFLAQNYGALTANDVRDFAAYARALENLMVIVDSPLVEQWLIDRIIAEFLETLPAFSLNVFNNGVINNQSLANAGVIRLWTRLDGVNANVLITEITAVDQDNNDAMAHLRRIDALGVSPQNGFDVNFNAPWQRIYMTVTVLGQTIELTLVNPV